MTGCLFNMIESIVLLSLTSAMICNVLMLRALIEIIEQIGIADFENNHKKM